MTERESMWAYVAMKPEDTVAMMALADLLESGGEDELASALRWAIRNGRRPYRTVTGDSAWTRCMLGGVLPANDPPGLPWAMFSVMVGTSHSSPPKAYYRTWEAAFVALGNVLAELRRQVA